MGPNNIHVSAPGKLMILGEHAVLYGKLSVVCAINRRLHVRLRARNDDQVHISSNIGHYSTTIKMLEVVRPFRFVLGVIVALKDQLKYGFDLDIESEFSDKIGFGSSSAATVATMAALVKWMTGDLDPDSIFGPCLEVVREVQGAGSGADVAASVYGGILAYRSKPSEIIPLKNTFPITVIYAGYKTPTTAAIRKVEVLRDNYPELVNSIFDVIDESSRLAISAIDAAEWRRMGEIMNINQGLMDAIGVTDKSLSSIVYDLRDRPGILGSKISGSGLGDCVIGLGELTDTESPHGYQELPVRMDLDGIKIY